MKKIFIIIFLSSLCFGQLNAQSICDILPLSDVFKIPLCNEKEFVNNYKPYVERLYVGKFSRQTMRFNTELGEYDVPLSSIDDFVNKNPSASVRFCANDTIYNIPIDEMEGFLTCFPEARMDVHLKEYKTYNIKDSLYSAPISKSLEFERQYSTLKRIYWVDNVEYAVSLNYTKIFEEEHPDARVAYILNFNNVVVRTDGKNVSLEVYKKARKYEEPKSSFDYMSLVYIFLVPIIVLLFVMGRKMTKVKMKDDREEEESLHNEHIESQSAQIFEKEANQNIDREIVPQDVLPSLCTGRLDKQDNLSANKPVRKFSKLFVYLIYLMIIGHLLVWMAFMGNPVYKYLPGYITTFEGAFWILSIIALLLIKNEYKFGFWAFIILKVLHNILWYFGEPDSYTIIPTINDLFGILFLFAILCIKQNGVSGWKVLFGKKD